MRPLTYKQRLFVEAYLGGANGNATEAARLAGYAWPDKVGIQLLGKTSIRAAIDARLDSAALSTSEILARLSDHASADIADFIAIDKRGRWKLDLDRAKRLGKLHVVRKVKQGRFGPEIELHNALEALDKLARYRGLLAGKGEVSDVDDDYEIDLSDEN